MFINNRSASSNAVQVSTPSNSSNRPILSNPVGQSDNRTADKQIEQTGQALAVTDTAQQRQSKLDLALEWLSKQEDIDALSVTGGHQRMEADGIQMARSTFATALAKVKAKH